MNYPRITIITPSFNQGQYLEETIQSVIGQGYPNLEYFVVDGGSTDNSADIIRKYASSITWWVSEKDKGQTDAINKGLARATGDIINWINSDDMLAPGSLQHIAEKFAESNPLCLCGPITMFRGEKKWEYPAAYKAGESLQSVFGRDTFNQPGTFFHRDAIQKMGLPDQRLHFVMDKEWFIRYLMLFGTEKIAVTSQSLALYRVHEATKTVADASRFFNEYAAVVYRVAEAAGENELLALIKEKYSFDRHEYRYPDPLPKPTSQMAQQMTALLLLRRFHRIYKRNDFEFGKRMVRTIRWDEVELDEELNRNLAYLRKSVSCANWAVFCAARKLGITGKY